MIKCNFEDGNIGQLRHVTIDAIVVKDESILLIKRAKHLSNGSKYGLPGGYLDRDEMLTEGVIREVLEETGYKIKIQNLFKITDNPNRKGEDKQNVEFTYLCEIVGGAPKLNNEVEEIAWFKLDKLPDAEKIAFDHYEQISYFLKYKSIKFNLPII
jgi:8-oxo-dGTP diphosphatase